MVLRTLFDGVRRVAITTAGLGGNRLELLGVELQEELERQAGNLVWLIAAFVFGGLALLLASILLLIIFWDTHRIMVAVALPLVYAVLSVVCVLCLRYRRHHAPPAFALTVEEFRRDQEAILGKSTGAQ